MAILQGMTGLFVFILIAYVCSNNRRAIDWRLVLGGVVLQILFGFLIIKVPLVSELFKEVSEAFVIFLDFSLVGAEFLFGDLAKNSNAGEGVKHGLGFIVAFQVLPTIIFFATISAALYYLGIMQRVIYGIAWLMSKTMRLSGPESLSAAGNIFLGQTEAPLLVKPFIKNMTMSELMCLMTGGMATIAGGVLAAYVSFLGGNDPTQKAIFAAHLLSASMMSAPAAIVMAKILIPETETDSVQKQIAIPKERLGVNLIDAMSTGASDGLKLALNVGGMLLAFIAVIAFFNAILYNIGEWVIISIVKMPLSGTIKYIDLNDMILSNTQGTFKGISLEYILGQICRPLAFVMGVKWEETLLMGSLLGQKTVVNEFVAYLDLARMQNAGLLGEKSVLIATYALCGFSNFASIAIQIGGIGGIAPERQSDLSRLGIRALLGASLACFMTATIAGAITGNG